MLNPWPYYDEEQKNEVLSVLSSGRVNSWTGTQTAQFESEFSDYLTINHSIALANGSLALSASYLALGLKPGDEVITTPRTFVATASALALLGVRPVFADVDLNSGNITPETVEPLITNKTKAISVVHLAGWPADMPSFVSLTSSYNLLLIEDCAQAHGAKINGKSVGTFSDISAWSFCQDKIISTGGEGGMISTNLYSLWSKVWSFKDHGKSHDLVFNHDHPPGFRWLHEKFGSNFRITEMQSAIGRHQLRRLDEWQVIRARNAYIIASMLSRLPGIRVPLPPDHITHAFYKLHAYIEPSALSSGWTRDRVISEVQKLGYPCFSGSCSEIYREKCFVSSNLSPSFPLQNAKFLGSTSLMFLVHPTITEEQSNQYALAILQVLKRALK